MSPGSTLTVAVQLRAVIAGRALSLVSADDTASGWVFRGAAVVHETLSSFLEEVVTHVIPGTDPAVFDDVALSADLRVGRLALRYAAGTGEADSDMSFAARCELDAGSAAVDANVFYAKVGPASVLGLDLPGSITLEHERLFGPLLSSITVDDLAAVYATGQVAPGAVTIPSVNPDGTIAPDRTLAFRAPIPQGLSLAFTIESGETTLPVTIPLDTAPAEHLRALLGDDPGSKAPRVKWIQVQKTLGPLTIQQIGAGWMAGVALFLDSSVKLAGLTVGLKAFSVSFPLSMLTAPSLDKLHVGIGGLSLAYEAGPTRISGAFLALPPADPSDLPDYEGEALIEAAGYTLSALGAYSSVRGEPSLFVFGMLGAVLGGPPFFFVTGVAAGFGYNRTLRIPTLDELPQFPLVQAAVATTPDQNPFRNASSPADALTVLHDYLAPQEGANWIAAGVRFTSFEMIQSFALLTVTFGTQCEIALLGRSTLTVPTGADNPIGFAEMVLEASFQPDTGLFAVNAKLTPASYVLSKACQLTGGFAFYMWFKDSADGSASAGDFVVTLGGYHPHFVKPASYPDVPRVGALWRVNDNLIVKASLYFALTPAAVMGGGSISAIWTSGDLRAWFDVDADFLLAWKPFHYEAEIDLSLGASYTIDLLFTTATITAHLGVHLSLWGPSFAGTARVDLYVVSFTISFGNSTPAIEPIAWDDFRASFLPKADSAPQSTGMLGAGADAALWYSRVASGLLKDVSGDPSHDLDWVLDPEAFELVSVSAIPSKTATLVTGDEKTLAQKRIAISPSWATGFGVGPMGVANDDFTSDHTVTLVRIVEKAPGPPVVWQAQYDFDFSAHGACTALTANLPSAAWSKETALSPSMDRLNSAPRTIAGALVGLSLKAASKPADRTLPISLDTLEKTKDVTVPFTWAPQVAPTTDTFDQTQAMATFKNTIGTTPMKTRDDRIAVLQAQGMLIDAAVHLDRLKAAADVVLLAPPILSLLGEARVR